MNRHDQYRQFVQERKACTACNGLTNAAEIDGGINDSDRIGPYSRWQGNLDAELMVVAQDFADVERFRRVRGWPDEHAGTNLRLVELLAEAGITIEAPCAGMSEDRVFFTNAVLCMKRKDTTIPKDCFRRCGERFLRPMIELVAPQIVVTLGGGALQATCHAFGHHPPRRLADAATNPIRLNPKSVLMPLYHPSGRVFNRYRSMENQRQDWRRVRQLLARPLMC
ncbi:MAG: uracil-DNA glycosylase family protein [Phycisphaeraceae bacterium]